MTRCLSYCWSRCRGNYNGLNVVTNQEIDNRHHTVHSPNTKPYNTPQGRAKVQPSETVRKPHEVWQL